MNEKKYPNPKFSNAEQEDEYWKTHSPLDEGYKGEIQKTKQKRTSFLSIRLTGEELTRLRDKAARLGIGPSTFARLVLRFEIESGIGKVRPDSSAEIHRENKIAVVRDRANRRAAKE